MNDHNDFSLFILKQRQGQGGQSDTWKLSFLAIWFRLVMYIIIIIIIYWTSYPWVGVLYDLYLKRFSPYVVMDVSQISEWKADSMKTKPGNSTNKDLWGSNQTKSIFKPIYFFWKMHVGWLGLLTALHFEILRFIKNCHSACRINADFLSKVFEGPVEGLDQELY